MQTVTVTLIVATILTNYVAGYLFHGKTFLKSPQDDLNDHEFRSPRSLNGSKLMLTPLIARGEVKRARHLANVDKHHFLNVTSFAGYLTVNETTDSNMWFWFFPAEHVTDFYNDTEASAYEVNTKPKGDLKDVPLVLWLQGGPGCTSMFALFEENGPFIVNDDYSLKSEYGRIRGLPDHILNALHCRSNKRVLSNGFGSRFFHQKMNSAGIATTRCSTSTIQLERVSVTLMGTDTRQILNR